MIDLIEILEDYRAEFSDRVFLTKFLRSNALDTIIDYETIKDVMTGIKDEEDKASILIACIQAKNDIEQGRSHRKGSRKNYDSLVFDAFRARYKGKTKLTRKMALSLCSGIGGISITGKDLYIGNTSVVKAFKILNKLDFGLADRLAVIETLLTTNSAMSAADSLLTRDNPEYKAYYNAFKEILKCVGTNITNRLDFICAISFNKDSNDIELENKPVYYSATGNIIRECEGAEEYRVSLIEPSPFFIRKWKQDDIPSNIEIDVVISNDHIRSMLKPLYDDTLGITFRSYDDFFKSLNSGAPDSTIIFATRVPENESIDAILSKLEGAAIKEHSLYIFGSDDVLLHSDSLTHQKLSSMAVSRIDLLPQGINCCTFPARKTFLHAYYGYIHSDHPENIAVSKYSLNNNSTSQMISLPTRAYSISRKSFNSGQRSLRSLVSDNQKLDLSKSPNKRSEPRSYPFTKEIQLSYSVFNSNDGTYRIRAHAVLLNSDGKKLSIANSSLEKKYLSTEQDILEFLEKYPYSMKRTSEDNNIQSIISSECRSFFKGKSITLKTFLYIYPELSEEFSERVFKELSDLLKSDLGDVDMSFISTALLTDALNDFYLYDEHRISIFTLATAVSDLFDIAIAYGHCRFNPALGLIIQHKERFQELDEVSNALGKRFLMPKEIHHIINICSRKIKIGAFEYFSVILRLALGLESNIIAALKWSDFKEYVTDTGEIKYQLRIERQIGKKGSEVEPLKRVEQIRLIPVISPLAKILLDRKESLLSAGNGITEQDLKGKHIIPGDHKLDSSALIMLPKKINSLCLELIKDLDIPENYLPLPDNKYGILEANLNATKNDIYKNTFRHYLLRSSYISLGDMSYLLGIQAPSVDFGNYIDSTEPRNQAHYLEEILENSWNIYMEKTDE